MIFGKKSSEVVTPYDYQQLALHGLSFFAF